MQNFLKINFSWESKTFCSQDSYFSINRGIFRKKKITRQFETSHYRNLMLAFLFSPGSVALFCHSFTFVLFHVWNTYVWIHTARLLAGERVLRGRKLARNALWFVSQFRVFQKAQHTGKSRGLREGCAPAERWEERSPSRKMKRKKVKVEETEENIGTGGSNGHSLPRISINPRKVKVRFDKTWGREWIYRNWDLLTSSTQNPPHWRCPSAANPSRCLCSARRAWAARPGRPACERYWCPAPPALQSLLGDGSCQHGPSPALLLNENSWNFWHNHCKTWSGSGKGRCKDDHWKINFIN